MFGQDPTFGGVAGTGAELYDGIGEQATGAVEGSPVEVSLGSGVDEVGGLEGCSGLGEVVQEPTGAEFGAGGRGWGMEPVLVKGEIVEGGRGAAVALNEEAEGRGRVAEVGLDDFQATALASFDSLYIRYCTLTTT